MVDLKENNGAADPENTPAGPVAPGANTDLRLTWNARQTVLLAAGLLVLAVVASYSNSFRGPFIFDDESSIVKNPTIRSLWSVGDVRRNAEYGMTVTGRPLLNLSLAINYAISGLDMGSYHVLNLAIHILATLLLFAIVRRTLLLPSLRDRWEHVATPLAFVVALYWAIHPLQTGAVTYIIQRAESLMGMFYLLTLYCVIRGAERDLPFPFARGAEGDDADVNTPDPTIWYVFASLACLLGMACKEVMVSAPLIVLLYDRAFLAGSFREAGRKRGGLYVALASTWLLLGWLVHSEGNRGGSTGFSVGLSCWEYLCTQFAAIVHYLQLCIWPQPLVFDYGVKTAHGAAEIMPGAVVVCLLGLVTLVALWRWPKIGFLGAWFFAILAPSSSFVPIATQTMAEHRMYLPLAAVVTGLVVAGYLAATWLTDRGIVVPSSLRRVGGVLIVLIGVVLGVLTLQRNIAYSSASSIWGDTADKLPDNARAHGNFGRALLDDQKFDDAIVELQKALQVESGSQDTERSREAKSIVHANLGFALLHNRRFDEAIEQFRTAIALGPRFAGAHYNLAMALDASGRADEAIAEYQKALELEPNSTDAVMFHAGLAAAMFRAGRIGEAISQVEQALSLNPEPEMASKLAYDLGSLLVSRGQIDEAIERFQTAVKLDPQNALAKQNLDYAKVVLGKLGKDLAHRNEQLELHPKDVPLLNDMAWTLATNPNASLRNGKHAISLAEQAVELSGGKEPAILGTLAAAYAEAGRFGEAVQTADKAIELAIEQKKLKIAESMKAKLPLYKAETPFRAWETPPPQRDPQPKPTDTGAPADASGT